MEPVRVRLDATGLMRAAVTVVDEADLRGEPRPINPVRDARKAAEEIQRTAKPHELDSDPHRFEVAFGHDSVSGRTMALLYADHAEFTDTWEALPEVEK